jgi:hypothetical protein
LIPALIGVGGTLLLAIVGVVFQAGALGEQLKALRVALEAHRTEAKTQHAELRADFKASARDQGRRIGNLESYIGLTADGIPVERMGGFSGRVRAPEGDDGNR